MILFPLASSRIIKTGNNDDDDEEGEGGGGEIGSCRKFIRKKCEKEFSTNL